jgi:hypothetical protein
MKKLNSVLLGAMLLTSALLIFAPRVQGFFQPELFVSPGTKKFYAPCVVSTEFDISVKLLNQEEETGYAVYAFDFYLYWLNSTFGLPEGDIGKPMIKLVKIEVKPPWPDGQYFIIKNETNPKGGELSYDGTYYSWYHLAITALNTAPPLTDVKIPVVDLTFHIENEPIYPVEWITPFHIGNGTFGLASQMSGQNPKTCEVFPIPHSTEDGSYTIVPKQPEMWVVTEKPMDINEDGETDFYYIVRWTNCTWFTVDIEVKNVGGFYSFYFKLYYNASLLNTDYQHVHIKDFLPPPYTELSVYVYEPDNPWEELGYVEVHVERPCEKPPVCGSGKIVNIDFHTKCPTEPGWKYILPTTVKDAISFGSAYIDCKWFDSTGAATTVYPTLKIFNAEYWFIPKLTDLDQSGHVDLIDLGAIAKQYGKSGNPYADAFTKLAAPTNQPVDLLDVVTVAKQFCKPYTPKDPYTGLPYDP